jgi:phosphoserine phosphatase
VYEYYLLMKHMHILLFFLQARQPGGADLFICYAGVQMREAVARDADWIVFNFKELVNNLS